ncbi:outer membrane protein assembly factor BamA [Solitalea koreensis]|uniref:Outer membrane protein assembly factor BamA n=1 Tax=Solitalea koreensis TaxID=543615 RepID=A0A521D0Q4_9SPHI|nr:outer membrane protein assembly factor BamA [Solitalea koreensis]SMO65273.1 Beta-barrel assembly machine subunit BamA [Solitalea koreensis]
MKKILAVAFFTISFFNLAQAQIQYKPTPARSQSDPNSPKEYIIGGITVSGTKSLDKDVLITISKLKVGEQIKVPSDKIANSVKDLWAQGLFNDVQINIKSIKADTVFLDLYLEERPRLSSVVFRGLKKSEVDDLNEKKLKDLVGKVVNDNLIQSTEYIVKKFFVEKGYYNTEVSTKQRPDSASSRTALIVTVDKKSKTKVNAINITGDDALSEDKLKKSMKDTKERKFYKIFGSKKFLYSKYEEDKKNIIKKYHERGYRDAVIVSDSVYRVDDASVNVDLKINEGKKYYFGNISWAGNAIYRPDYLNHLLQIKKGDIFDEEKMDKRLHNSPSEDDISSLYLNNGYLFFNVSPVQTKVYNDTIDVEMQIFEGEQATINKVSVNGNDRTNDKVVLREIRTKPGDKFNKSLLIRTIRELNQLGYFDEQKTSPDVKPNAQDGTVDLAFNVTEKPSDQLELSGGFGGGRIIGTLGLTFNNFSLRKLFTNDWGGILPSGDGQKLQLRAQTNGKYYQAYNFSFSEPWLGGDKPRYFSVGFNHTNQNNGLASNNPSYYQLKLTGFNLGLGQRLKWPDDYFQLNTNLNFDRYNFVNYPGFQFPTGTSYTFSITEALSRNSIDVPIYPTTGSHIKLSVQLTPPYSLFSSINYNDPTVSNQTKYKFTEFHRWKFDASWFAKLSSSSKFVFNFQTHYGFLGTYNKALGVTQFDRWRVGGDGLAGYDYIQGVEVVGLRGYSNGSIVPEGANSQAGSPIYSKYTMELRYPISTAQQATIFALTFLEGGNTWENFRTFSPFNLKRSAGVGVRIFLPIFGMLGLDYGYGFDAIPGNPDANRGQFHFSIAQQLGSGF